MQFLQCCLPAAMSDSELSCLLKLGAAGLQVQLLGSLSLYGFAAEVAFPNYAQVPPLPPDVELDLLLWIQETAGK
jgi:hypothetical protein